MTRAGNAVWLLLVAFGCACTAVSADGRRRVHSLSIDGVRHVDGAALRRALVTEPTSRLPWGAKRYFDPFELQLDELRLGRYYQARGYFDARVVATDVRPAASGGAVDVTIDVEEGPATKIEEARIDGLDPLGDRIKSVVANFDVRKGQIFNHELYVAEKAEVLGRLRSLGFAFAVVSGEVLIDRDAHRARVEISVAPGPQVTFGALEVRGAPDLDVAKLQRHMGFRPGQLLTAERLEDARAKLYNLELFASVKLTYVARPDHPELADVLVEVAEAPRHVWRIGAGLSFDLERTEVRGRVLYAQHYFLGGLRTLRLRFEPAYVAVPAFWNPIRQGPAATAEAQLTQSDLLWTSDELKVDVGYDLGLEYAFQYHGPRAQLGYSRKFLHDRLQLGVSYSFQYFLFFNTDPALLADPVRSRQVYGYLDPYRLGWVYEEATLDLRDQPFDPRQGGYFAFRAEEGGVYSGAAFTYEKLEGEARGYLSLGKRLVIAGRTEFGQLFSQGDLATPITRRFYLGGPDSHRGFNYSRLSPQIPSGLAGSPALPIGGDELFLMQLEVRLRAARILGYWFEIAAFADIGDVAQPAGQKFDRIDLSELHYAVGGGLRFQSVIGTIRADMGVRLNRLSVAEADGRPNPDPGARLAFHISIGEPF